MRRVNFVSVSEATSIISCANFSAYDIEISGNRGHSAVRSNSSSRVFIGKVYDHSSGYRFLKPESWLNGWKMPDSTTAVVYPNQAWELLSGMYNGETMLAMKLTHHSHVLH